MIPSNGWIAAGLAEVEAGGGAKVDLHCHSTASEAAKLGIQRSVGLPECATPPKEVYELAKRRGMDFVTITDHDTIQGCLEIADRQDVFVSEELTAWFRDEHQAVHVLCYGIDAADHEFLQANSADLEECAAYLHESEIACALAHPFFAVAAPLGPRHRRRLAELFPVWEVRNGSRAPELNMPAAVYIETHGGTGVGGSDDHAGVDIGRTWTETPGASTPEELLARLRRGEAVARGAQGSAAKWAHSALALATRALLRESGTTSDTVASLDPEAVLRLAERVVNDGTQRGGTFSDGLGPDTARELLSGWLDSVGLGGGEPPEALVELMQRDDFSHSDFYRRARRQHERRLDGAVQRASDAALAREGYLEAARGLFEACVPVVPYVPAIAFLGREQAKLAERDGDLRRVALVVDGVGSMHGVAHTIERIREQEVPGFEVDVIGTDPRVDRRLPAVAEVDVPFYPGLGIGVPSIPELAATLSGRHYDLVHVVSPGPAGIAAMAVARIARTPLVGSYHTELTAYAGIRSGDSHLEVAARAAIGLFYGQCSVVLSPSQSADESLRGLGVDRERITRWARGVDLGLYDPGLRDPEGLPGDVRVLYAGRLTKEKGVDLLAEAFTRARERDPRLHLILAGGGPEEDALRNRLGDGATFLGWLGREDLARAYASSDIFLFCSRTDTYGQVIVEAQASGLPVVAVAAGGPLSLIADGHTGCLRPPDGDSLAAAVVQLAGSSFLRDRLAQAGLASVKGHTWDAALTELGHGYERALQGGEARFERGEPGCAQGARRTRQYARRRVTNAFGDSA
jgi:glycosyltransferase involved in cell wall biosynthesis/predicted metal-dependent phosphoesterase TrpH